MTALSRTLSLVFWLLTPLAVFGAQEPDKSKAVETSLNVTTYRQRHYRVVELRPKIKWQYKKLSTDSESVFGEQGLTLNNSLQYKPIEKFPFIVSNRNGIDLFKNHGYLFNESNLQFYPDQMAELKPMRKVLTNFSVNEYIKIDKYSRYTETSFYWQSKTVPFSSLNLQSTGYMKFPNNRSYYGQNELTVSHRNFPGFGISFGFNFRDLAARPQINLKILR